MTKAKPQTKPQANLEVSTSLPSLALPPVLEVQGMLRDNLGHGGLNPTALERVTIPAGGGLSFTLPTLEGEEDLRSFEAVILLHTAQRNFWSKPYTGEDTLPDCSSADGLTGVGDPGGECHFCPLNAWGSHPSGTSAKACKETRTLYQLRPGELLPITLSVPPSSLGGFAHFVQRLSRAALRYSAVRTHFALERTKSGGASSTPGSVCRSQTCSRRVRHGGCSSMARCSRGRSRHRPRRSRPLRSKKRWPLTKGLRG